MTKLSTIATRFFAIASCAILAAVLAGLACVGAGSEPTARAPEIDATVVNATAPAPTPSPTAVLETVAPTPETDAAIDTPPPTAVAVTTAPTLETEATVESPSPTFVVEEPGDTRGVVIEGYCPAAREPGTLAESTDLPPAPSRLTASYGVDGIDEQSDGLSASTTGKPLDGYVEDSIHITAWFRNTIKVTAFRILSRNGPDSAWDLVESEAPNAHPDSYRGRWNWSTDYLEAAEYAVCLGNDQGFGRALTRYVGLESHTEDVDPPTNIQAVAASHRTTVYWEPSDDPQVVGYDMVHGPLEFEHSYLFATADDRAENFSGFSFRDPNREQRFRVRSLTVKGPGPWSETVRFRPSDRPSSNADALGVPRIVSASPTHTAVHLVFEVEGITKDVRYRVLRRRVGANEGWTAHQDRDWIDVDEYIWDWAYRVYELSWTDVTDVLPDTKYEYAVQFLDGEELSDPSASVFVSTKPVPDDPDRLPLPVRDVKAVANSSGIEVTWVLPDDPTLTGILLWASHRDHDLVLVYHYKLSPSATRYLYAPRASETQSSLSFEVQTINDNGLGYADHSWVEPTTLVPKPPTPEPTPTVVVDATVPPAETAATVETPSPTPVPDTPVPDGADDVRGFVIDGFCPAARNPGTLEPATDLPPAPSTLLASYHADSTRLEARYGNLIRVTGYRLMRRDGPDSAWELVGGEHPNPHPGSHYGVWSWRSDKPEDGEYAVCLGNNSGFGRALTRVVGLQSRTEDVDPPPNIRVLAASTWTTVYWDPSSDPRVIGYEVVSGRTPAGGYNHFRQSDERAKNFAHFRPSDRNQEQQYRVRSLTRSGHGRWSETVWYRPSDQPSSDADTPGVPRIVSVSPSHNAVHLVFVGDGSRNAFQYRMWRRQVGTDAEWSSFEFYDWAVVEEFRWGFYRWLYEFSWTDVFDVLPDTEYEYAIELRWHQGRSESVRVRTKQVPNEPDRLPLPVRDVKASSTHSRKVEVTWELPDDPTITGILVTRSQGKDGVSVKTQVVLPPTATRYLLYSPKTGSYYFVVQTVNEIGLGGVGYDWVFR